ncbi:carboxymuconolactone decarboxylase family protein (plasmid) [Sphingobium sp. JS3065]|uniref:carboxymuconolactone decarboxylase family protein n=1 Tax=Sphingobium sp. JS3065 TaxID=2970925 RepID=UPI002263B3B8|nr:carboxymuconolactone decarboxylase family protein [Sphingobium sp. JS3065]UZW58284.1 carboxymuconolactone decarboxylase family protein [Sphingobium sp. JS3065]
MLIPMVTRDQVEEKYHKLVFDGELKHEENRDASSSKLIGVFGHSPAPLLHMGRLGLYLRWKSQLDPRLRQLAMVATMKALQCDYATIQHCRMSMVHFGCTEGDVRYALGDGEPRPGTLDEKVVMLANVAATTGNAPKWLVKELHAVLGHRDFLDLAHSIGIYQHFCTVLNLVDIGPPETHDYNIEVARQFGFTTVFDPADETD